MNEAWKIMIPNPPPTNKPVPRMNDGDVALGRNWHRRPEIQNFEWTNIIIVPQYVGLYLTVIMQFQYPIANDHNVMKFSGLKYAIRINA